MREIFQDVLASPTLIGLTVAFFLLACVTTFDKRINQAKRVGTLPVDEPSLPSWVAVLFWLDIGVKIAIFIINWKYGIILYAVGFLLAVTPILETIGNFIMSPFKARNLQKEKS